MRLFRREEAKPESLGVTEAQLVATAKLGGAVQVEREKTPAVDFATRLAQVVLGLAAIVAAGLFIASTIGEGGLRTSSVTRTVASKTGGNAGMALTTRETTPAAAAAANTVVREEITRPYTVDRVAEISRPSDVIVSLMGVIALGLFLISATLPRLQAIEIQGIKLTFTPMTQAIEQTGHVASIISRHGTHALSADIFEDPQLANYMTIAPFEGREILDPDKVAEWTQAAVTRTMREAQARQVEAAFAGADPAEARLSDEEIDEILRETRPH